MQRDSYWTECEGGVETKIVPQDDLDNWLPSEPEESAQKRVN
jgi:hypothetical protein